MIHGRRRSRNFWNKADVRPTLGSLVHVAAGGAREITVWGEQKAPVNFGSSRIVRHTESTLQIAFLTFPFVWDCSLAVSASVQVSDSGVWLGGCFALVLAGGAGYFFLALPSGDLFVF